MLSSSFFAICAPCGVISVAKPSLPFTVMICPSGATVSPRGSSRLPPTVRVRPFHEGVERVNGSVITAMRLFTLSATES